MFGKKEELEERIEILEKKLARVELEAIRFKETVLDLWRGISLLNDSLKALSDHFDIRLVEVTAPRVIVEKKEK